MKRTLALLLALVMLLGMLPMSAFADTPAENPYAATIRFEHDADVETLKVGDTFTVTAYMGKNPGFAVFEFDLEWNDQVVRFDGYQTYQDRVGTKFDSYIFTPNTYNDDDGKIVLGADANTQTLNPEENHYLFIAKFTVVGEGAPGIGYDAETFLLRHLISPGNFADITATMDLSGLKDLSISHVHDYTSEVTPPTCTDGGFTTYTCTCGDSYTGDNTPATGHTNVNGTCSVCGAAMTVIPNGAKFIDMVTDKGEVPNIIQKDDHYLVEVPYGTTSLQVTYPEALPKDSGFGNWVVTRMSGFEGVTEDSYDKATKDGKTTVGLILEKAPDSGEPIVLRLINLEYPEKKKTVGICMNDGSEETFALTYMLDEGEHFAILPEPEKCVGYTVSGSPIAKNGYTFNVSIDEGYEATADFAVKVNGTRIIATEPGDITVDSVTEDMEITVTGVSKIVEVTDISVTVDLRDYAGTIDGYLGYMGYDYNYVDVALEAGKANTLSVKASDCWMYEFGISKISPLVIGYEINGTTYAIPDKYTGYDLGGGFNMNMDKGGYIAGGNENSMPGTLVIKPVMATAESLGAAPDFTEDCVKVNDISVVGADVVSAEWNGDVLNVILAEDTALDATFKTMWNVYAKNTNDPAMQNCVMFNGKQEGVFVAETGGEGTFDISTSVTLANGVAAGEYKFEPNPNAPNLQYVLFTPKTFTVNFYVSGKEPAPEQPSSNPITKIELSHPNIVTDETTGTMTMAMVTGASETIDLSFTVQNADQEATQEIAWSSSDPEVATVENGKVTALKAGSTVITAKAVDPSGVATAAEGEEVLAQFTLTVSDPTAGYTVTMGEDKTVDAGEKIQIPVTVGYNAAKNETAPTTYKSYELTFQYDTDMLTLVTGSSEAEGKDFTVVEENGTVTIRRYGEALNVGAAAVTLEFTANKTGESDVKLTSAKIGTSDDAQDEDIPVAAIIDNLTKITVTGYDVDLDEAFTGADVADPEKDYTFEAKDKNYVYTVTVTVGDETFEISDEDQDGTLIIPKEQITGNMEIKVKSKVGKTFNVTIEDDAAAVTGNPKAQYMTDYVLSAADGVGLTGYTIKYKIGNGEEKTMTNYTIPGSEITGDITITVTAPGTTPEDPDRPANSWKITFEGNGKDDVQANSYYVTKGEAFTFSIEKADGYTYIVTYPKNATEIGELTADENGNYSFTPDADVTVTVMKWHVEVNQYVALNGKTVFLVSVAGEAGIGMQYDGNTMFIKSVKAQGENGEYTGAAADKYVYLVELAEGTLTVEAAARKLSIVENVTCETVGLDYNVNGSSNLDINDAQLVYDMYNNVYESIATVGMKKFLRADIGGDRIVNVQDAIAVVTAILTPQA